MNFFRSSIKAIPYGTFLRVKPFVVIALMTAVLLEISESGSPLRAQAVRSNGVTSRSTLQLSTASLPAAEANVPYSASIKANGTAPYTFSLSSGSLPAGLSLGVTSGVISGVPVSAGSSSFTVKVVDSNKTPNVNTADFALPVNLPLTLSGVALPQGQAGTHYSGNIQANAGTPPYSYSVSSGSLPNGVSLTAATGVFYGVTPFAGSGSFAITVRDASGATATANETIKINDQLAVATPSWPAAIVGKPYSVALPITGGVAPYNCTVLAGTLPAGMTLSNCSVVGTPTQAGSAGFKIRTSDSSSAALFITIAGNIPVNPSKNLTNPLSVAAPAWSSVAIGSSYSASLMASGGTPPYNCAVVSGSLPVGLSLSGCTVSGTVLKVGTASFVIQTSDASNAINGVLTSGSISTTGTPLQANPQASTATAGKPYSANLGVTGGLAPYTCALASGSLPAGLTLSQCAINGTPAKSGMASFVVAVSDASGPSNGVAASATINVLGIPLQAAAQISNATLGTSYAGNVNITGGTAPYTCSLASGNLPAGLTLSQCSFSGTPTKAGLSSFQVAVVDSSDPRNTFAIPGNINVAVSPLVVQAPAWPVATIGSTYSLPFQVSGGLAPYTCSLASGVLPSGMSLSSCAVIGTPSRSATSNFVINVSDASGSNNSMTSNGTLKVIALPLTVDTPLLPAVTVGSAYSIPVQASGGVTPYTCTLASGSLPAGMTLSQCVIGGSPSAAGTSSFKIDVTDANTPGTVASTSGSLTVTSHSSLALMNGSIPSGSLGVPYRTPMQITGGVAPYTCAVTSGHLPDGISMSQCSLTGTPTNVQNTTIKIKVTDASKPAATVITAFSFDTTGTLVAVASPTWLTGVLRTPFAQSLKISGGIAPYFCTVSSGSLPAGLTLSQCALTGTPTTVQSATFSITTTDSSTSGKKIVTPGVIPVTANSVVPPPMLTLSTSMCPAGVIMTDTMPGTQIYYTTDGSTPTPASNLYSSAVGINNSASVGTVQAIAVFGSLPTSTVATLSYGLAATPPSYFPLPGPYTVEPGNITLSSATSGANIYYTLDGTIPTVQSALYNGPIAVNPAAQSTTKVQAIAVSGNLTSCASQASYTYIPTSSATSIASVTVDPTVSGIKIPSDFAGVSMDHNEIARWSGPAVGCGGVAQPSCTANPIFSQLLNNLITKSGSTMFLRVEGDGAMAPDNVNYGGIFDNNCQHSGAVLQYPQVPSAGDPTGFSLMGPLKALMQNLDVKVSLGIDLGCNHSDWAAIQARNYYSSTNGLGPDLFSKVAAFEIGNEPDNYISQNFRCNGYGFLSSCASQSYLQDWEQWAGEVTAAIPGANVKFMDPSTAGSAYSGGVVANLNTGFNVAIVSQHNYPVAKLAPCVPGQTVNCNPPDVLLQSNSVYGSHIGPNLYHKYMQSVHETKPGTQFRIAEFNDIAGGGVSGLSDTFQSALWLLDVEFEYASLGYDGTNVHTGEYTNYNLWGFKNNSTLQFVKPKYYGLLAFEMAAGHGAKLVNATTSTTANLTTWATVDANNHVHVVIINKDEAATGTVTVTVPGYSKGTGTLLTAPSFVTQCKIGNTDIGCSSGVTLGNQTFDGSKDGQPLDWAVNHSGSTCPLGAEGLCSQQLSAQGDGIFTVTLPITSALIIELEQ